VVGVLSGDRELRSDVRRDREAERQGELKSPFAGLRADLGHRGAAADTIIVAAAVIASLYFGRDVLVPVALAVLLSFVLAPVAVALAQLRIGKVASVLFAVTFALAVLVGLGVVIGNQVAQLGQNIPAYQSVIARKMDSVKSSALGSGFVQKAAGVLKGLDNNLSKPDAAPAPVAAPPVKSSDPGWVQVEVHAPAPGPIQILQSIVSALLPPLATAGIVLIFVVFILLQRTDLRDRFIGLIGSDDLHRTTKALDEAARRLSQYFLALTAINATFGVLIGLGLSLIGVPNPILWGIMGAALRFVPYIGAFIAAALPLALAAAVDPGWSMVAETAVLFVVLEGLMGQVVEPLLFGHTTGMSPLAIIISAAFWTLVWGPAGLLLSTPITACIVVLGRHVESLNFIELILGDSPALSPIQSFYQRILASDPDEVAYQAEVLLETMPLLSYYEEVALPALALAQLDATRGVLDFARQREVCDCVGRVVSDLSDHVDVEEDDAAGDAEPRLSAMKKEGEPRGEVLCLPGRSPLDEAACAILAQLLERNNASARALGPDVLTTGGIFTLDAAGAAAICMVYLDHKSLASVRFAVRRVRKTCPGIPIVVCLWGNEDLSPARDAARADATVNSLRETIAFCAPPHDDEPVETEARAPLGLATR